MTSFPTRNAFGYSNLPATTTKFVNTPIWNIRLPVSDYGNEQTVSLENSLSSTTVIYEHKSFLPKNTQVVRSKGIMFFYVNRRYVSPMPDIEMSFKFMNIPGTISPLTKINSTEVDFNLDLQLQQENFQLTSVVVLNPLIENQLATGCSTIVIDRGDMGPAYNPGVGNTYLLYNPLLASNYVESEPGQYSYGKPITRIPQDSSPGSYPLGFRQSARRYGTIFLYVNPNEPI
jgi:hypothetical protein